MILLLNTRLCASFRALDVNLVSLAIIQKNYILIIKTIDYSQGDLSHEFLYYSNRLQLQGLQLIFSISKFSATAYVLDKSLQTVL